MKRMFPGRLLLGVILVLSVSISISAQSDRFVFRPVGSFWLPTNIWFYAGVSGGYYLLAGDEGEHNREAGYGHTGRAVVLDVLDVSNPVMPFRLGSLRKPIVCDFCECIGMAVGPNRAYMAGRSLSNNVWHSWVGIVNLENPSIPLWEGSLDLNRDFRGGGIWTRQPSVIHWSGGFLYVVVTEPSQLLVFDAHNPPDLLQVASLSPPEPDYSFTAVGTLGQNAYIACGSMTGGWSLQAIDVRNPAQLNVVGSVNLPRYGEGVSSLSFAGGYAYLGCHGGWKCRGGVVIIDISDPSHLKVTGQYGTDSCVNALAATGSHVVLATCSTVRLLDASNPCEPLCVATDTHGGVSAYVGGGHAYVMSPSWGLTVLESFELPAITRYFITDGSLNLQWNEPASGMRLQQATSLTKPDWQNLFGSETTNAMSLPVRGGQNFFRLAKP